MTAVRPTGGRGSTARMVGTTAVAIAAVSGVAAGHHRRKRRLANLAKKGAAGGRCPAMCVAAVRCGGRLPDGFRWPGAGWAVGLGRAEAGRWPVAAYGGHVHCVTCTVAAICAFFAVVIVHMSCNGHPVRKIVSRCVRYILCMMYDAKNRTLGRV